MSGSSLTTVLDAINQALYTLIAENQPISHYLKNYEKTITTEGRIQNFGILGNEEIKTFQQTVNNTYWKASFNHTVSLLIADFSNFFNFSFAVDDVKIIQSGFQDGLTFRFNFKATVGDLSYQMKTRATSAFGGAQQQSYLEAPFDHSFITGELWFKITSNLVLYNPFTNTYTVTNEEAEHDTVYDVYFDNVAYNLPSTTAVTLYVYDASTGEYTDQGPTSKDLTQVHQDILPQLEQIVENTLNSYFSGIILPLTH